MSFESYRNIGEVLREFQIVSTAANFVAVEMEIPLRESFQEELEFNLREFSFEESEYAVCETLIFPVLREVYRLYLEQFTLWSHKPIFYSTQLSGIPDYIVAKRSPLGKEVFEQPYLITIEAKKDDFIKGWGQCLAEMIAIQKLSETDENKTQNPARFGIVSNGQLWQFGKLEGKQFTKNIKAYTIYEPIQLLAALNFIFHLCSVNGFKS